MGVTTGRAKPASRRRSNLSGDPKARPIVSRKSTRANARREKARYHRHTLTRSWEDRMWEEQAKRERADRRAEQGPRHWYGAWVPYGVSAFMGGHPGREKKKRTAARRRRKGR